MNLIDKQVIADSYLEHIKIALDVGDRSAPFRTFFDNWYAYQVPEGHLSKSGTPIWFNNPCARTRRRALLSMHFISEAAMSVIEQASSDRAAYDARRGAKERSVRLMVDHAIPVSTLVKMMFDEDGDIERSRAGIRGHLERYYRLGVLAWTDDIRVNTAGLRSKMPNDWDRSSTFARYERAAIARFRCV